MKKLLIGTTALVAVGMAADGAFAAEKIKLGLGGYFRAFFAVGSEDVANQRGHGIGRESEVYFTGETTLDNGLRAGAMIQLEGETSTDQIDNSYIWFKGGFGDLRIGSFWGPGVAMHYAQAGDKLTGHGNFASHVHVSTPSGNSASAGFSTYTSLPGNADKVVYYTPRMGGVQLGIGYTPDNTEENADALNPDNDNANAEIWDLGINFKQKFGETSVGASAVYAKVTDDEDATASNEPRSWSLGAFAGFAGFKVGASYKDYDADATGSNVGDSKTWEVGASYGQGPWSAGITYANEEVKASSGDDEMTYWAITGKYALGPGVEVNGGIQRYDWEDDANVSTAEGDATVFIIGTKLSF